MLPKRPRLGSWGACVWVSVFGGEGGFSWVGWGGWGGWGGVRGGKERRAREEGGEK